MSDLIDREALLRQIDIDSEGEPGYYGDTWKFIDTIKRMPSALGTNLAEVGTDCISREQAIEIIEDYPHGDWNVDTMSDMVGKIKQLPPIQPKRETATVSVGMSKGGVTMWYECEACGEPVDQGDTFCSGCGRELIHE